MLNNLSSLEGALIGLAVLVFFIVRQFTARPVLSRWTVIPPLVLAYFGLQNITQLDQTGWVLLGINLSLGVALGFMRGVSFRIWRDIAGTAIMRGTSTTLLLWLATLAVKIGLSVIERQMGFGVAATSNAEMLLPAAATFAAQGLVVYLRAEDLRFATAS